MADVHRTEDPSEPDAIGALSGSRVTINVQHQNGVVILQVSGEIDLLTAPQVEEAVMPLVRQQPSMLVVDLSGVSFLASAGLNLLVAAQQASGDGTRVRVVANDPRTFRPIEITGLSEQIAVFPSLAEALKTD